MQNNNNIDNDDVKSIELLVLNFEISELENRIELALSKWR